MGYSLSWLWHIFRVDSEENLAKNVCVEVAVPGS